MKTRIRILLLITLTGSGLWLTACEEEGATPQPTSPTTPPPTQNASLAGKIQPANAITLVTATNAAGGRATALPDGSGTYALPGLAVGAYTLAFTPAAGYAAPADQYVTVGAAGATVPPLSVVATAPAISYQVDGVTVTPTYYSAFPQAAGWLVDFSTRVGGTGDAVTFFFEGAPAVGIFSLGGGEGVTAQYRDLHYATYRTEGAKGGTVTITAISASARLLSGTFSFVGTSAESTSLVPATRTITSGTFTNVPF